MARKHTHSNEEEHLPFPEHSRSVLVLFIYLFFAIVMKGLRRSLKSRQGLFQPLVLEASVHGRLVSPLLGYDEVKHDPGRSLW